VQIATTLGLAFHNTSQLASTATDEVRLSLAQGAAPWDDWTRPSRRNRRQVDVESLLIEQYRSRRPRSRLAHAYYTRSSSSTHQSPSPDLIKGLNVDTEGAHCGPDPARRPRVTV